MLAHRPRRGKRPKRISKKKHEKEQAEQNVCLCEFLILNYNEFVYSSSKLHRIIISITYQFKIILKKTKCMNINIKKISTIKRQM